MINKRLSAGMICAAAIAAAVCAGTASAQVPGRSPIGPSTGFPPVAGVDPSFAPAAPPRPGPVPVAAPAPVPAPADDFGPRPDNGNVTLSLRSFQLAGAGCPAQNSARLTLIPGSGDGLQVLNVEFGTTAPEVFQANSNQTRVCTVRVQLTAAPSLGSGRGAALPRRVGFAVTRIAAGARFFNGVGQGRLQVTAQTTVNGQVGPSRTVQLPNSPQATFNTSIVNLTGAQVQTAGAIDIATRLTLQVGAANSAIRFENLGIELRLQ